MDAGHARTRWKRRGTGSRRRRRGVGSGEQRLRGHPWARASHLTIWGVIIRNSNYQRHSGGSILSPRSGMENSRDLLGDGSSGRVVPHDFPPPPLSFLPPFAAGLGSLARISSPPPRTSLFLISRIRTGARTLLARWPLNPPLRTCPHAALPAGDTPPTSLPSPHPCH